MGYLITTTVSVDAHKTGAQVTLHIVQGDTGTRRFQFIPISGGKPISLEDVAQAQLLAISKATGGPIEINCSIENGKVYAVPTPALVADADEFACQLVLLNASQEQLHTMPFTVIVHGTVFEGDAVEHTNTTITDVEFDENGRLLITLADGTVLVADKWDHTHPLATDEIDGFMSKENYVLLQQLGQYLNQGVKTTDEPTFAGLHIGDLYIDDEGVITGLRFT